MREFAGHNSLRCRSGVAFSSVVVLEVLDVSRAPFAPCGDMVGIQFVQLPSLAGAGVIGYGIEGFVCPNFMIFHLPPEYSSFLQRSLKLIIQ